MVPRPRTTIEVWTELGRRAKFIQDIYNAKRIPLNPGEGLALALEEARSLAAGIKTKEAPSQERLCRTVNAAHVIYSIAESIEVCEKFGLDISSHLAQMSTGTADYGRPAMNNRTIYLKDFEYELFVISSLLRKGIIPRLFERSNDPLGDLMFEDIVISCKHPNSLGQLKKLLGKFNRNLMEQKKFGVFAVALEDCHNLGDTAQFESQEVYASWLETKQDEMEIEGKKRANYAARLSNIAGLINTQTMVKIVAGKTKMERFGNSMIFDQRASYTLYENAARAITGAFNPIPVLYSSGLTL